MTFGRIGMHRYPGIGTFGCTGIEDIIHVARGMRNRVADPVSLIRNADRSQSLSRPFPRHCAKTDVAPAEALRPHDPVHCRIGAFPRLRDRGADGADIEDASATSDDAAIIPLRSSMEDFHALDPRGFVEAAYDSEPVA
jgi:hypothetical protein